MKHVKIELRKHVRYNTDMEVYFRVKYDIKTRVKFKIIRGGEEHKYSGLCKNVSVEGLCFVSNKKLNKGNLLLIEVYEPIIKMPVIMEAKVCWCKKLTSDKKNKQSFATGVQIVSVNGESVPDSIHIDKEYKVAWSVVLESLFGDFVAMIRKLKKKKY